MDSSRPTTPEAESATPAAATPMDSSRPTTPEAETTTPAAATPMVSSRPTTPEAESITPAAAATFGLTQTPGTREFEGTRDLSHSASFDPSVWDEDLGPLSPWTYQACLSQGIEPHELRKKELSDFLGTATERVPEKIARMRLDHYEERRVERVQAVMGARDSPGESGDVWPATGGGGGDWIALKRKEVERRAQSEARRSFTTQRAAQSEAKKTAALRQQVQPALSSDLQAPTTHATLFLITINYS